MYINFSTPQRRQMRPTAGAGSFLLTVPCQGKIQTADREKGESSAGFRILSGMDEKHPYSPVR